MNSNILHQFDLLILKYQELAKKKKNQYEFKAKTFIRLNKRIKELKVEIKSGDHLLTLIPRGVGPGTIRRIDEIIKTGTLKELVKTDNSVLESLKKIHGIGPAKANKYIKEYKLQSIDDFKNKISSGDIVITDKNIQLGLKHYQDSLLKIPRAEITRTKNYLTRIAKQISPELELTVCGSYRRGKTESGDMDALLTHNKIYRWSKTDQKLAGHFYLFLKELKDQKFLVDDLIQINPQSTKYMGYCNMGSGIIRRIDLRAIPYNCYYPALMYFTGSGSFNQYLRKIAKNKGYILNEYGLYPKDKSDKYTDTGLQVNSEKDIFDLLDHEYLRPEERNGEF